mgnify:CR=1 FL=1
MRSATSCSANRATHCTPIASATPDQPKTSLAQRQLPVLGRRLAFEVIELDSAPGNADVLTFSPEGKLLRTEAAAQPGNDGLVIMKDGTKYVSSVLLGGVSRIRPGKPAEMIAQNIPNPASMCYDAGANQLVIPMNANNGLAFIPLR